jgi:uncharacterized protein (TIGR02284 family)
METAWNYDCQVAALNDLIRINNDRITSYKKRMDLTLDDDLEDLFARFIYQSKSNIEDMVRCIRYLGGKLANSESLSGKFYHAWMDFKSAQYRQSRQTMLDYCEYGEDVAKSTYQKVLADRDFIQGNVKAIRILEKHLDDLKASYKLIKSLHGSTATAT